MTPFFQNFPEGMTPIPLEWHAQLQMASQKSEHPTYLFLDTPLGWGTCSETLTYSKSRHISWQQMMTEHRGLSV